MLIIAHIWILPSNIKELSLLSSIAVVLKLWSPDHQQQQHLGIPRNPCGGAQQFAF